MPGLTRHPRWYGGNGKPIHSCFLWLVCSCSPPSVSDGRRALAQVQEACPLPPGVEAPAAPRETAQQVEDGSTTLMDFALAVRDQYIESIVTPNHAFHLGCLIRQEGSHWRSGSTYVVLLTPDGTVFVHAKDMRLSGRKLTPEIHRTILGALGINPADLADPAAVLAALRTAAAGKGGPFNAPNVPGDSGYAAAYISDLLQLPMIMLVGFELDSSHVLEEKIDHVVPTVTARDVVDRETLKAFVTEAEEFYIAMRESEDPATFPKAMSAMRDPNGPWRHGSVTCTSWTLPATSFGFTDRRWTAWPGAVDPAILLALLSTGYTLLLTVTADTFTGGQHNSNR